MNVRKLPKRWWVYLHDKVQGPFTFEEIKGLPNISERTRVCLEHSQEWMTLGQLSESMEKIDPALCSKCGHRSRAGAKFCDHCGGPLAAPAAPPAPLAAGKRRPLVRPAFVLKLLAAAAVVALALFGAQKASILLAERRKAQEPTGRLALEVRQVVHARSLRDVRGEDRVPLPGKRFCLVTLHVRDADGRPALFDRGLLRWVGPDGRSVPMDGLTTFIADELSAAPRLEPGGSIEGRIVFQVPQAENKFKIMYGRAEVPVPAALLVADRRWRGQEAEAEKLLRAFQCRGPDGKARPWEAGVEIKARQELGPLYHVDAQDEANDEGVVYGFHVDLETTLILAAPDADTIVNENTRRECFGTP